MYDIKKQQDEAKKLSGTPTQLNSKSKDNSSIKDDEDQNDVMELNEASRILRRSLVQ